MEAMREAWTDERLDDLAQRMDRGFDRLDARFERLDIRFERLDARIDDRFDAMNARFDAMQRTMLQIGGGLIGTLIVAFAGVFATQL
jgi:hypothetical protein